MDTFTLVERIRSFSPTLHDTESHSPTLPGQPLSTLTPLQNSLLELYGLASLVDDQVLGDLSSFRDQLAALGDASIFAKLRALATRLFAHAAARGKAQAGQIVKPRLLTSDLQGGIALLIPKDWSIEQALAVVELRGGQQKFICRHYHP